MATPRFLLAAVPVGLMEQFPPWVGVGNSLTFRSSGGVCGPLIGKIPALRRQGGPLVRPQIPSINFVAYNAGNTPRKSGVYGRHLWL